MYIGTIGPACIMKANWTFDGNYNLYELEDRVKLDSFQDVFFVMLKAITF